MRQTVRTRMAEYRAKTAPILPYYEAKGLVSRIDGMADIAMRWALRSTRSSAELSWTRAGLLGVRFISATRCDA